MVNARLEDFNTKFVYTKCNPENIVEGKKDSLFFRNNTDFYFNPDGVIDSKWKKLPYRTVIIPPPSDVKILKYEKPFELWIKTTDGYIDQYGDLMPKTGWKFLSYQNIFFNANPRLLRWIFPPPISSTDPIGNDNSRSYDENFFYAKIGGFWVRTPISIFTAPENTGDDNPLLSSNLPFVDAPRYLPVPPIPEASINIPMGEQSYDTDFFYIRVSKWKRSKLNVYYNTHKMTRF